VVGRLLVALVPEEQADETVAVALVLVETVPPRRENKKSMYMFKVINFVKKCPV
jgi:hypothetical protein